MVDTHSASLTDIGKHRRNNEDFVASFEPADANELQSSGCLYVVADGVGGAAQGERASRFAAQKLLYEYYRRPEVDPADRLRQIIEQINEDIHSYSIEHNTRMATTIVAVVVRAGQLYLANVGDSRIYLIRDGVARQLNRDHSLVGEMVAHGEMTESEALESKVKNTLTRSVGGEPVVNVDVYPPMSLKPGDKILLCSDGLTRYALSEDISGLTREGPLEEIAQRLVDFANGRGGADNVSVVIVSYQGENRLTPAIRSALPQAVPELEEYATEPHGLTFKKRQPASFVITGILVILVIAMLGLGIWLTYNWINHTATAQAPILSLPSVVVPTALNTASQPTPTQEKLIIAPTAKPADTLTPIPTAKNLPPTATLGIVPQLGDNLRILNRSCKDFSKVAPGKKFTITWTIQNIGTTTWNPSYKLMFTDSFPDAYFGPKIIPFNKITSQGESEVLIINLQAPSLQGEYTYIWLPKNDAGNWFPNNNLESSISNYFQCGCEWSRLQPSVTNFVI